MNAEINFLPESFVLAQAKQKRKFRQVMLLVLVMMAITGWYLMERDSLADLRAYAQSLQTQAEATNQKVTEMSLLRDEYASLTSQLRIQRELAEPVSCTVIVATLGRMMPPQVAVSDFTLKLVRPKPAQVVDPDQKKKRKSSRRSKAAKVIPPHHIELTLMGISPDDQQVAAFIGELTEHKLFSDVKLHYTRASEIGNYQVREFRVDLKVPLDRDYRPIEVAPEQVVTPTQVQASVGMEASDDY